jgi:hypothetical protein
MEFNMAKVQGMIAQMQKKAAKMQKTMAQMHKQNNINYTRSAQYLQAVSGVFNSMAQYESQMYQFYSGKQG